MEKQQKLVIELKETKKLGFQKNLIKQFSDGK